MLSDSYNKVQNFGNIVNIKVRKLRSDLKFYEHNFFCLLVKKYCLHQSDCVNSLKMTEVLGFIISKHQLILQSRLTF